MGILDCLMPTREREGKKQNSESYLQRTNRLPRCALKIGMDLWVSLSVASFDVLCKESSIYWRFERTKY